MKKQLLVFVIVMSLQPPFVCAYQSILEKAIKDNNSVKVEQIINNQSYDHAFDKYKRNELHQAVRLKRVKILKLLLEQEASRALIENQDFYDMTPLEYAAQLGSIECAVLLISYNAQIVPKIENRPRDKLSAIAFSNNHELLAAAFNLLEKKEWDKKIFINVMNCLKVTKKFVYPNHVFLECELIPISDNEVSISDTIAAYRSLKLQVYGINFTGIY